MDVAYFAGLKIRLRYDIATKQIAAGPKRRITPEIAEQIRIAKPALIAELSKPNAPASIASKPSKTSKFHGGVGTELKKIIPGWFKRPGCGCESYAKELDQKGILWCVDHQTEIVEHVVTKATETFVGSLSESLDRVVAKRWVKKAIRNAKAEYHNWLRSYGSPGRVKLPSSVSVITACDQKYLRGAYFLAWTLLRANDCKLTVYDIGLDHADEMVQQMRSWGVEFVKPVINTPRSVNGWQTYEKPFLIRDATSRADKVIWIDADTSISKSILPIVDVVSQEFFVPDHGHFHPKQNANHSTLQTLWGPPVQQWREQYWPCTAVIGAGSYRDAGLIAEWCDRTTRLMASPGLIPRVSFFDQGVLQDLYAGRLQDGNVWNNLKVKRTGTVDELMRQTYGFDEHAICHFGGRVKPWYSWDRTLDWGDPRK